MKTEDIFTRQRWRDTFVARRYLLLIRRRAFSLTTADAADAAAIFATIVCRYRCPPFLRPSMTLFDDGSSASLIFAAMLLRHAIARYVTRERHFAPL